MQPDLSDEDLAVRAPDDRAALTALYERHYITTFQFAERRMSSVHAAEDVAGETWTRVLRSIGGFTPQGAGSFLGWVLTIERRLIVDEYRAGLHRPVAAEVEFLERPCTGRSVEDEVVHGEQVERVQQIVLTLRGAQQQVVRLRFFAGMSAAETAQVVGKSEGAVRVMQHRALRDLAGRIAS